jgi:hypothetical protein
MADVEWVFVERCQGVMRRVTALDQHLGIVTTHERPTADPTLEPDEFQLLRAVKLGAALAGLSASSTARAELRSVGGALGD